MAESDPQWSSHDRAANVVTLRVHVQPGARRTAAAGLYGDRLKIRLAAPPVDGKANAALLAFIAHAYAVPLRNVELTAGATSRNKTVRVNAPQSSPAQEWLQVPDSGS